jgi:flagellar basal-body rod protein FlgG
VAGQSGALDAGRLQLARFANEGALTADGDGVYRANEASGEAIAGRAGQDGMGALAQGFLETSNVKLIDEMVNMMIAQRGYEASMKVVQAADELSGMVNNLRK